MSLLELLLVVILIALVVGAFSLSPLFWIVIVIVVLLYLIGPRLNR